MQALDLQIRVHGWSLAQIDDDPAPFSYTVGLLESYGHPELVILDVGGSLQQTLLRRLVAGIAADGRLPTALLAATGVRCVEVHPDHLHAELFAAWVERYGRLPRRGEVLQVQLPDSSFCECHVNAVHRLERPASAQPVRRAPTRAERRRRPRRGRAA